jgi:hypothetical protein
MKWISVKDRLPSPGKGIVFFQKPYPNGIAVGSYSLEFEFEHETGLSADEVTHWMYEKDIPKPGEED